MDNKNVNVQYPSFLPLLGIAFIVLKLCKVITWSWIWVLAPFWIGVALYVFFVIVVLLVAFITKD